MSSNYHLKPYSRDATMYLMLFVVSAWLLPGSTPRYPGNYRTVPTYRKVAAKGFRAVMELRQLRGDSCQQRGSWPRWRTMPLVSGCICSNAIPWALSIRYMEWERRLLQARFSRWSRAWWKRKRKRTLQAYKTGSGAAGKSP